MAREEQFNKLLKIAQVDDHPVELALSAIGKQMIRSLADDEQDELLEELRNLFLIDISGNVESVLEERELPAQLGIQKQQHLLHLL